MSIRRLQFIGADEGDWTKVPEGEPVHPRAGLLLDWAQWLELRDRWPQGLRVGVVFPNDADVKDLLPDLQRRRPGQSKIVRPLEIFRTVA